MSWKAFILLSLLLLLGQLLRISAGLLGPGLFSKTSFQSGFQRAHGVMIVSAHKCSSAQTTSVSNSQTLKLGLQQLQPCWILCTLGLMHYD